MKMKDAKELIPFEFKRGVPTGQEYPQGNPVPITLIDRGIQNKFMMKIISKLFSKMWKR
jgi:hypothetical protein